MDNEQLSNAGHPTHPLDIIRQFYKDADLQFDDSEDHVFLRLWLERLQVSVTTVAQPGDIAGIIMTLPVRADEDSRARVGEFLHRINYAAKRKFWEIDYEGGGLRLSAYTDLINGPLTAELYGTILHTLTLNADAAFPYLMNVITGRMNPGFAADQALAALHGPEKAAEPDVADPEPGEEL